MLQTFRERSKIPIILVFILVVICFGFFFNATDTGMGRGQGQVGVVLQAGSRNIKVEDFDKLRRELTVLSLVATPSGFTGLDNPDSRSIREFLQLLQSAGPLSLDGSQGSSEDAAAVNAVANLLALRAQSAKLGIGISHEQIKGGITRLPLLLDAETGQFSAARLDLLSHGGLPTLGGGTANLESFGPDGPQLLQDAVTDWLTFLDLREALAPAGRIPAGLSTAVARLGKAQTEAWTFEAASADFQPAADEVDQATLEAWHAQNSLRYQTAETRDVVVATARAPRPAAPAAPGDELLAPATAALAPTAVDDATWDALRERFRGFYEEVAAGANFEEAAARHQLEVKPALGISNDPENLALDLGGDEALRQLALSTRPDLSISQASEDRGKGRIAALRVTSVNPPGPQPLEAVRERVLNDYRRAEGERLANVALGATRDAAVAHWGEKRNLDGFQPAEAKVSARGPRYFGHPEPTGLLDATARTLALGTPSETLPLPPADPAAGADAPRSFGFVLPVARRIAADQQPEVERQAALFAEQLSQGETNFLVLDWFRRARAEARIAVPKRR